VDLLLISVVYRERLLYLIDLLVSIITERKTDNKEMLFLI